MLRHLFGREERRRGGIVQLLRVWLELFGRLIDRKAPPALGRVIEGKFDQSRIFGVFAAVPSAGRIAAVGRKHAKDELGVDLEHEQVGRGLVVRGVVGELDARQRPQRCEGRHGPHGRQRVHDQEAAHSDDRLQE